MQLWIYCPHLQGSCARGFRGRTEAAREKGIAICGARFEPSPGQLFQYILRADDPERFDAMALRGLNDWVVKLLLMPVDGITEVLSFGGEVRQYQVLADPKRLLSYGLSVQDLAAAIEANNRNAGGWYLDRGAEQLSIRGVG